MANCEEDAISLEVRVNELEDALENICKHMEVVCPTGYRMSGVWNIAKRALKEDN